MSKAVKFEDIREGDVISYTRKVKVTRVHLQEIGTDHGSYSKGYLEAMGSLDLVERPRPALPTKLGSVVSVSSIRNLSAMWFLNRDENHNNQWTSETGKIMTAEGFERFLESHNYDFEEIA